jgi:hypothetical protein
MQGHDKHHGSDHHGDVRTNVRAMAVMTAASSTMVQISLVGVPTAQGVFVNYVTSTTNQPKSNANHIYVWQTTSNSVPWNKTPDGDSPVSSDSSTSTQSVVFDFEDKGYIIGYATAPSPKAVCATIFIPQGKQNDPTAWQYDNVTAQVVAFATNIVQAKYHVLSQYTPATNKNWVGLFLGPYATYSGPIMKKASVPTDIDNGYVTLEGVKLLIGTTYTVGYFLVDESSTNGRTSLAASSTFTVGQALG